MSYDSYEHFKNVIVKIRRTIKNYVLIIYKYNLAFCTLNDFNNKHNTYVDDKSNILTIIFIT